MPRKEMCITSLLLAFISFSWVIPSFAGPDDNDRMGCIQYNCFSCCLSTKDIFFALFPGRTVGFSNSGNRTVEIHLLSGRGWLDKDTKKFTRYRKITVNNGTTTEDAEFINIKPDLYSSEWGGWSTYIKAMLIKVNTEYGFRYYRLRKMGRDYLNEKIRKLRDSEVRVDVERRNKNIIDISAFIQNENFVEAIQVHQDINEKCYLKREIGEQQN